MKQQIEILFAAVVVVLLLWIASQVVQQMAGGLMTVLEFVG